METKNVLILWGEAKPNFPVVDNPDDAHLQAQRAARVESARKFIMHLKALCASFECIDRDTCKVALPLASVDALKRARGYETFVAQVKAHRLDIAHLLWDERPREDITMTTPAPEKPRVAKKADRSSLYPHIMAAVKSMAWSSYAEIARYITPIADAHGRNVPYNQTVLAVKELVQAGVLCYRRPPLAGHRAEIGQQMIDAAISPETLLARNVATMDFETED